MVWGRGLALVASIALALVLFASPVVAQPDEEIEMEPETGSGSAAKPTPPAKPAPAKPAPPPIDMPADPPADPPPDGAPAPVVKDPKLAKKVAATAVQAALKGDALTRQKKVDEAKVQYEAAVVAYLKAIELGDDANLYYDLGLVEEKLGKLDAAATHWRAVTKAPPAAAGVPGVRPDVLKKATTKFDDATTKLGLLALAVKPDGATISLNDVELGKSPLALPLILMPGTYTFKLAADGHQLKDVEIKVEAGSESERGIDLEPIKIVIDTSPPIVDDPPPPPPKPPSKLPLFVGAGATAGFLLISTVTGLVAVGKHGKFTAGDTSNFDREVAAYDGKNYARVADITLVATLGAAGFTAYWYFLKYRPAQRKLRLEPNAPNGKSSSDAPQRTKASVLPWVKSDGAGLSFGGGF